VDSPASAGCLDLLRTGARLVRDADDILEDLAGIAGTAPAPKPLPPKPTLFDAPPQPSGPPPGLDGALLRVWESLTASKHADELARESGIPPGELAGVLMRLELKKAVRRLAGNHWERR
jgi:DNA processing protein